MTANNTIAGFQLSTQQARIWSQHAGEGAPYRAWCEVRITGTLNEGALHKAFRQLVGRHEVLRTVFQRQAGVKVPFQVILESSDLLWETVDVSGMDAAAERAAAVDLEQGAPLR